MGLRPVHHSITPKLKRKPKGMSHPKLDAGQRELVERLALEAFNDCVAVGMPLQNAVTSVFLSGIKLAVDLMPLPDAPNTEGGGSDV